MSIGKRLECLEMAAEKADPILMIVSFVTGQAEAQAAQVAGGWLRRDAAESECQFIQRAGAKARASAAPNCGAVVLLADEVAA